MIFKTIKFKKTAAIAAVFYFLYSVSAFGSATRISAENSLEIAKKKAINLLMQSQKKQALAVLTEYLSTASSKSMIKNAYAFRLKIAKTFLTKEAQEFYEMSLNLTIDNPKASRKSNEECLNKDPENFECLIQKARLLCRERKSSFKPDELEPFVKYFEPGDTNWIKVSCEKSTTEFRANNFFKKDAFKASENKLVFAILELERSVFTKNFSRAREVLSMLESENPDWPELAFFKNKINAESTENNSASAIDNLNQYKNKCKNLSKSVARKYKYDFDLCLRGI